jgi:hypothetical protein
VLVVEKDPGGTAHRARDSDIFIVGCSDVVGPAYCPTVPDLGDPQEKEVESKKQRPNRNERLRGDISFARDADTVNASIYGYGTARRPPSPEPGTAHRKRL